MKYQSRKEKTATRKVYEEKLRKYIDSKNEQLIKLSERRRND